MSQVEKKTAKFLIIRFSSFGDVVQSLSLPSAIEKQFPGAEVHWITRQDMAPLLAGHPHIRRVWKFDRKAGLRGLFKISWQLRGENFDYIYDAHNNLRSRIITWTLRPFGFVGWGAHFIRRSIRRWKRFLLFRLRINTFEQPFSGQRDLLEPLQPWGISKLPPPAPQFFPSQESLQQAQNILQNFTGAVMLAASSAHELKRWPVTHWQELIRLMPEQKFVLLGGPEDTFFADIQAVAPERVLNLAGKMPLLTSSAAVTLGRALVSNDTGLLHVAEQTGKATIALMGPAPFGFPSRSTTKIMELDLACRPCSKHGQGPCVNKVKFHQCLVDITPSEVATQLRKILEKSA